MNNKLNEPILFRVKKSKVLNAINEALKEYRVAALIKKEDKVLFDYIEKSNDIIKDYAPTVLSPKKFFLPKEEVILDYTSDEKLSANIEAKPVVLFGIRPCDLNAINILDQAFAEDNPDPNYLAKRESAVIIGMDCKDICNENSFCYKINANKADGLGDIMLYDLKDDYGISVFTQKGAAFKEKYISADLSAEIMDRSELDSFIKEKEEIFQKQGSAFKDLKNFPEIFEKNKDHKVWQEEGDKCLSCGSCILVCPTCYCFDVQDELALNLKTGQRIRRWDACMLKNFAEVAGGENFRENKVNRLKHRINRKFNFLMKKYGQSVCVGCGRCVRACLAEISPNTIAKTILTQNV